uniref:Uncharacterized protein n=1 Tax=Anopheles merus TaxID=30066 RepID=A0A182USB9_ANOME
MDPSRAATGAERNASSPDEAGAAAWADVTPIRKCSSKAESCLACGAAGVAGAADRRPSHVAESVQRCPYGPLDGTAAGGLGLGRWWRVPNPSTGFRTFAIAMASAMMQRKTCPIAMASASSYWDPPYAGGSHRLVLTH